MESFWLLRFHLVEAVPEDWFLHQWVVGVKVYSVNLKVVI